MGLVCSTTAIRTNAGSTVVAGRGSYMTCTEYDSALTIHVHVTLPYWDA